MEKVIVTLQLPKDLFLLVQKYAKPYIVNDSLSNSNAIKNTSVLNSSLLESSIPTLDDVVAEVKRINSNVVPERFFNYYQKNKWLDKKGESFDWRQKLKDWGTYKLETAKPEQPKNIPTKCDFNNDVSFQNTVKDFMAENSAKEGAA